MPPSPDVSAEACRKRLEAKRQTKPAGQRLIETGTAVAEFGKALFWLGVSLLFTILIGIPILISLFR